MSYSDIGVIGLAVMGENLVLNMANHGFSVAVYNRTTSVVDSFIEGRAKGLSIIGCKSVEEFCANLSRPRKVMLMVKAGSVVDTVIEQIVPYLENGDIIIDGGNSHFPDTERRCRELKQKGILFVGTGISGGEEGALNGPSIMPGGAIEAWEFIKPIFTKIAAKADDGVACCDWVGAGGAGHFVKMVHNGIEYADMQLICEAYNIMRSLLQFKADRLHEVFAKWNERDLNSYLVEITADIFSKTDDETGSPLIDKILDVAGQKGTGKWSVISALDFGVPATLISEAVFARCISAMKDERVHANKALVGDVVTYSGDHEAFVEALEKSVFSAKIISYAQGFSLMRAASQEFGWNLNYAAVASMWRGGCIIRSQFLNKIREAFEKDPELPNLLLDPYFAIAIRSRREMLRRMVSAAVGGEIPIPILSSAICYFDSYRAANLPANLLQAQRDYFGAHTYERVDKPRGEYFHTNWTGRGGATVSRTYNV